MEDAGERSMTDDVRTDDESVEAHPVELAMNAAMAAARDRELTDAITRHWKPLVEAMEAIVARAVDRGELAADADPRVFVDLLTGPLLTHTLLLHEQLDEDYLERLVTAVQRALPPPSVNKG